MGIYGRTYYAAINLLLSIPMHKGWGRQGREVFYHETKEDIMGKNFLPLLPLSPFSPVVLSRSSPWLSSLSRSDVSLKCHSGGIK